MKFKILNIIDLIFDFLNEYICRVFWKKENEFNCEVEKLKVDIVKLEKSMDLVVLGVSLCFSILIGYILF